MRDGNAPREVQDADDGSYEGWCRKEDVLVDWNKSSDEVYNLIRGANPQPGAWTTSTARIARTSRARRRRAATSSISTHVVIASSVRRRDPARYRELPAKMGPTSMVKALGRGRGLTRETGMGSCAFAGHVFAAR